jgi:hypothetical protein
MRRTLLALIPAALLFAIGGASSNAEPSGTALHFTGQTTGSYVSVPNDGTFVLLSNFTVSADVRWDGTLGYAGIVSVPREDDGSAGSGYALAISDGAPCSAVATFSGSPNRVICAATPLTPGVWTHIEIAYTGTDNFLWIDGVLAASITGLPFDEVAFGSAFPLLIGREFLTDLTDRAFHGDIDNVRVSTGVPPGPLTTLAFYTFGEGSGLVVTDSSGNGHTGVISEINAPTFFFPFGPPLSHVGYCAVAGNHNPYTGAAYPAGKFLELELGQPLLDPAYRGAAPAIFVQGVGITCDAPPAGTTDRGKAPESLGVPGGVYEYWSRT